MLYYSYKLSHTSKTRVIKDFSYGKAAQLLNCSKATAHKQVKSILKAGLAKIQENGNLVFLGVNKLKSKETDIVIQIPILENKSKQIAAFRYAITYRNIVAQRKSINYKNQIVEKANTKFGKVSKAALKMVRSKGGFEKFRSSINNRITLSNKKFGKVLKRSQSSGKRYQKQFNELGFIKSEFRWEKVCKCTYSSINHLREAKNCFFINYYNGHAYIRLSNTIHPQSFA